MLTPDIQDSNLALHVAFQMPEKKKIIASVESPIVNIAPAPGQSISLNSAPRITIAAPKP